MKPSAPLWGTSTSAVMLFEVLRILGAVQPGMLVTQRTPNDESLKGF
jgi:hypothetical protein